MLNNVMMMGRLTADPEVKTAGENRYCRFSIAVQRPKRKGEETAETDFFNLVAWNGNADVISRWYRKGDMLMIIGTLRNSTYEKNGEKRVSTEIVVKEIHFTGGKKADTSNRQASDSISNTSEGKDTSSNSTSENDDVLSSLAEFEDVNPNLPDGMDVPF